MWTVILCLTCYSLWPSVSLYCGRCRCSFDVRLCDAKHRSPRSARTCIHCGSQKLSRPTKCIHLGWISSTLSWSVALLVLRFIAHHLAELGHFSLWIASSIFGIVTGDSLEDLLRATIGLALHFVALVAIVCLVGRALGLNVTPGLKSAVKLASQVARLAIRLSWFLVVKLWGAVHGGQTGVRGGNK